MLLCSENNTYADFWKKTIPSCYNRVRTISPERKRTRVTASAAGEPHPELLLLGGLHHRYVNSR